MQLFYQEEVLKNGFLSEEDSKHCLKVLRKKKGDIIQIVDGKGGLFAVKIVDDNLKKCQFLVLNHTSDFGKLNKSLNLYVAPTKSIDRIEWMLEKVVEIGISSITFLETEHTINRNVKIPRLEKIAISAMKQSLTAFLPKINSQVKFNAQLIHSLSGQNLICHLSDNSKPVQLIKLIDKINVFIGPEGDFSEKEIDLSNHFGFSQVSIGSSRLRTETAGLVAITALNLLQ